MKKLFFSLLLALGIAGAALADDFWEKKKFPDWSQKEVQKMLRDSPWARPVEIRIDTGGGRSSGGRSGGRRGGGGGMSSGMEGGGGEGGGMGGGGSTGGGFEAPPTRMAIIRWHTALPIKQAIAKLKFGDEVANSADAAKMLSRQETRYVVGITGVPMQAIRGNPGQMKPSALLKLKGKDTPIQTADIKSDRDPAGVNFYLFFPKGEGGATVITVEDNEVELVFKAGALEIKRKFKLKDMLFEGKLEI